MKLLSWTQFHCVFHFICLLVTLGLGISCLVKYFSNEDLSRVDYRRFHHNSLDNVYPSFSWCIINPFVESKLKLYGEDINVTSYSYFLQGLHWDDRMLDIDYDNVTVSLSENLNLIWLQLHNDTLYIYHHSGNLSVPSGWKPNFYVSFRSAIRKCFTFDIPFLKEELVFNFAMDVQNNLFGNGIRPTFFGFDGSNPNDGKGLFVYFHYPGQRFTSYYTIKYEWDKKTIDSKPYLMKFGVKDIEVIKHRNRKEEPCIENWKNFDQLVMDDLMLKSGCRPPHWNTNQNFTLCSRPEQMVRFSDQPSTTDVLSYGPPCRVIENLHYSYHEQDEPEQLYGFTNDSYFTFWVFYRQTTFREVTQIRAYDLDNLYGNIGGYMGLFLGYAILNIPTMFFILYGRIKKSMLDSRSSKVQPTRKNKRKESFDNNLLLIFGTTSIMLNTLEDNGSKSSEKEDGTDDNLYSDIVKNLDARLKKLEEKFK